MGSCRFEANDETGAGRARQRSRVRVDGAYAAALEACHHGLVVFWSTYETRLTDSDRLRAVGVLKNFYVLENPVAAVNE